MGRTANSLKNSKWGIISQIVMIIFPFLTRTVMIQVLGVEYLGLGSLFNSILKILNMAELGFGSAIVFSMYKPVAENDTELICALLNAYRRVYRYIGLVILALGLFLLPFLPHFIKDGVPQNINIYILYLIYLANSVISYLLFAYKSSILIASQRNDIVSKVRISFNVLMYVFQIAVLFVSKNYYLYVMGYPIFTIIINVITAVCATRLYPNYVCKGKISKELGADISKRVTGLMMNKVAFASRNALDSVIVSTFLGLQSVAIYNNYYYIMSAVSGVMAATVTAILPSIGNSIVTESKEKNENDMNNIFFIYMCLSGIGCCFLLNLYQPFMSLWVGAEYRFPEYTMIAFAIYFLVEKSENIIGNYYDATGMWWNGRWKGAIEAIVNLVLNIVLCKILGAFGVVIATMFSLIVVGIPLTSHFMYKYYFGSSEWQYLKMHMLTVVKFSIIGIVTYYIGKIVPEGIGVIQLLSCMFIRSCLTIIVMGVMFELMFAKTKQYSIAKQWFLNHFKIRNGDN